MFAFGLAQPHSVTASARQTGHMKVMMFVATVPAVPRAKRGTAAARSI